MGGNASVQTRTRRHIPGLTGLRGIGALWVVLYHMAYDVDIPVIGKGYLGVDLFFILSGFVLCYVHPDQVGTVRSYFAFLTLRLARIYPLHLLMMGVLGLIVLGLPGFADTYPMAERRFGADAFVASLLLVQNWAYWLPGCWNAPAWSLSAEWFAYLTFPVFQVLTQRWRGTFMPLVLSAAGFLGLYLVLTMKGSSLSAGTPGMMRMAAEFGAGCLLYRAWENGLSWPPGPATGVAIGLLTVGLLVPGAEAIALPALLIIVMLAIQQNGWLASLLETPTIVWLGEISYSLYLTHWTILQLSNWLLRDVSMPAPKLLLWSTGLLAVCILAAALTYRWFERPSRAWARALGRPARGHATQSV
ncbi:MAG: acyltransferase family protein [Acetobacteraceae bacterium]